MRESPEIVCQQLLHLLHDELGMWVESIESGGSVPLQTYTDNPYIDIFILTNKNFIKIVYSMIKRKFPNGHRKEGELEIWYIDDYKGYPVDFVVLDKDHIDIQTLEHTRYYRRIFKENQNADEMRQNIKDLKNFLKMINCYGAEKGGFTGIAVTRMIELYHTPADSLKFGLDTLYNKKFYVEDPVKKGRNLVASVRPEKKWLLEQLWLKYGNDPSHYPVVDLSYLMSNYDIVYWVKRKRSEGTDREYQFLTKCATKSFNIVSNTIKEWKPKIVYDTYFDNKEMYLAVTLSCDQLTYKNKHIPRKVLRKEDLEKLKRTGDGLRIIGDTVIYQKRPPFDDFGKAFQKQLYTMINDKYKRYGKV